MTGSQAWKARKKPFSLHERPENYVPWVVYDYTSSSPMTELFWKAYHPLNTQLISTTLTLHLLPVERALGIQWDIEYDCFGFSTNLKVEPATHRGILSTVASLYDPLGFVAPFLLKGKRVLQEMCRHGTGWDDPLLDVLQPWWENWRMTMGYLGAGGAWVE